MKKINLSAMIFLLLFLTTGAMAQPPMGGPPPEGPRREKIRQRIKTLKIWKLTEELQLNEQQSQRFFPIYNAFEADRQRLDDQRLEIIDKLDSLTSQDNTPDAEINSLLDRLEELDRQQASQRLEFRNKLKDILTTRQIGELVVFEVKFQRQIQDIIRDVRTEMGERFRGRQR
jgi:Spy/CpxP family protein refolding chaperone